jgi:hypothetical protein
MLLRRLGPSQPRRDLDLRAVRADFFRYHRVAAFRGNKRTTLAATIDTGFVFRLSPGALVFCSRGG